MPSIAVLAVALVLAVTACSGGSSSKTPTAAPITRIPDGSPKPTPISLTSTKSSVLLFSVKPEPLVREIRGIAEGVAFLEWLDNGTRVVGYNWAAHAYEILGVDAGVADRIYTTFAPQPSADANQRSEWAHVLPGGKAILLEHDGGPPRVYDVATGDMHTFTPPPGQNVVFTATKDGAQLIFNNIVEGRSRVMMSDLDGANARVLAANKNGSVGMIDGDAVSPDGQYLLLFSSDGLGGNQQWMPVVRDFNGTTLWRLAIPDIQAGIATEVQWGGPGRLLVTETKPDGHGDIVVASKFVSIPSLAETLPIEDLTRQLVSISPDGQHAIMRLGDGAAPWERRCALVRIDPVSGSVVELAAANPGPGDYQTVFCATVDWTPDGSQAIVSAGGI